MFRKIFTLAFLFAVLSPTFFSGLANAQASGFSVQVTPSPIIESLQPGVQKTVELKIRNTGTQPEEYKMGTRSFSFDDKTGQIQLGDEPPKEIADWVSFASPIFSVAAGEWFTQKITFSPPTTVGFAYSFAITVARSQPQPQTGGKSSIEGSVAVFTLLNIDRPDATRKLEIVKFSSQKKLYEYLPASFRVRIKNSGNTIVRPGGNVYIQRTENSPLPMNVLPLNDAGSYILSGSEREVTMQWKDGFPMYQTINGKQSLVYNWADLQKLRIGKFTAKAILVYSDGVRDVPIQAEVSFWVFPWKFVLVALLFSVLIIIGVVTIIKKIVRKTHKPKSTHDVTTP